ncbi:MAG: hypothetical protein AAB611_00065 [Patescibacteria group bacterium]
MIVDICLGWFLSFFVTAYVFPRMMRLFSYETDFFSNPAWVYVPSIMMWIVFFRTFPGQSNIVAGIVTVVGFVVSIWCWRSMKSIHD